MAAKRSPDAINGDVNFTPLPRKRATRTSKRAPPLYKALVIETADSSAIRVNSSTADIDEGILARMKKCLERANHPNSAEAEAKAALHLASRLMKQYNVSQAEVLAHEPPEVQRKYGGQSTVSITRRDEDPTKGVRKNLFVDPLCVAINAYFTVKSFSTARTRSLHLTFYGIADNTSAAAYAFEMVYNLIVEWARDFPGMNGQNSYCVGISDGLCRDAEKEKEEEELRAKKTEQDAMDARVRAEELQRQAELDRLADLPTPSDTLANPRNATVVGNEGRGNEDDRFSVLSEDSWEPSWASENAEEESGYRRELLDQDSESDIEMGGTFFAAADFDDQPIDLTGDTDDQIDALASNLEVSTPQRNGKALHAERALSQGIREDKGPKAPLTPRRDSLEPEKAASQEDAVVPEWASHMQLITFRKNATKIAEDYLKEREIKLRKGRKRDMSNLDSKSYKQGQKDSKKIDVRRKSIRETTMEGPEKTPSRVFVD